MTADEQKRLLRQRSAALRADVTPAQKTSDDAALCAHIIAHPAFLQADLILTYFGVRGEPDLSPLLLEAKRRGIPVAFPRCVEKELFFHTVSGVNDLVADRFGIPAPPADAPLAQITSKTLCLLPGLAAGRDGGRLGYGGGFYDRFLATFGGITLFPIYERLLFPTLPTDRFDRKADHIITEKGVIAIHV